jgi:hypothetical protein
MAVGLLLASMLAAGGAAGETAADVALARELFKEAAAKANAGQWREATELYARSLALKRAPITLYSLGVAQMNAGDLVEALETLRSFLLATDPSTAAYDDPARQAVADLERRVARAKIVVEPSTAPGLVVKLNGVTVPAAALGFERLVNPGRLELVATAEGHHAASESRQAEPGAGVEIVLRLVPLAVEQARPSEPAPPPFPPAGPEPRASGPLPWILIGGGAGVAAIGGVVGLMALGDAGNAAVADDESAEAARKKALVADIAIGVGAVSAAVGVVLLATRTPGSRPEALLFPSVDRRGGGVSARFVF